LNKSVTAGLRKNLKVKKISTGFDLSVLAARLNKDKSKLVKNESRKKLCRTKTRIKTSKQKYKKISAKPTIKK